MPRQKSQIAGWGRIATRGRERRLEDLFRLSEHAVLSRGLGRSYGDSSLPPPTCDEVVSTVLGNRLLDFNSETGELRAEAGTSLYLLASVFLARGWFVPVTPGTAFVTLGGMVAADVHGKNHHVEGCIGAHVTKLTVRVADGRLIECSPNCEATLFWATVGGMGLTGHILEVTLRMTRVPTPWIRAESVRAEGIDALLKELARSSATWPFTVAWTDGLTRGRHLGRGIVYRGRWEDATEDLRTVPTVAPSVTLPCNAPTGLLNRISVGLFNSAMYRFHGNQTRMDIRSPYRFFYPLDLISNWNRLYGRRGLTQYQCVVPRSRGPEGVRTMLELMSQQRARAFLCVIKDCGDEGQGTLSFPMRGTSLAIDLPVDGDTQRVVDTLNEQLIALGGRIYLAKDTFTRAEHFRSMEPRLVQWQTVRRLWDPELRLRSAQSVRLFGDPT